MELSDCQAEGIGSSDCYIIGYGEVTFKLKSLGRVSGELIRPNRVTIEEWTEELST